MPGKMKVLFIHNSVPEYRIEFWRILSELVDLKLLITDQDADQKIYGLDRDTSGLSISYWNTRESDGLITNIMQFDAVILPPVDHMKEYLISFWVKLACKRYRIPFILWTEKWEQPKAEQPIAKRLKNKIHAMMIATTAIGASHYIAAGSCSKKYLLSLGIPEDKVSIAFDSSTSPKPLEVVDIRNKYGLPEDAVIILYLGRLIHRKGCQILIEAVKPLLKTKQKLYLIVAGSGEQENELIDIAKDVENILFVGKIQPVSRRNYFEQSNLFVLPSIIENGTIEAWGLTVNEALECGTPVITTDAVGSGYDLINDITGCIVKNNDVEELRKAINTRLNTNSSRKTVKNEYQKYDVDSMAMAFYTSLVGARK